MDHIESKGKSVDEAIFNGLNELGASLDEVEIEILNEGSKGLFGIGKSAVVRMTKREGGAPPAPAYEARPERNRDTERPRDRGDRQHGQRDNRGRDRDRGPGGRGHADSRDMPDAEPPADNLEYGDGPASEFLNGLFALMKIDASCKQAQATEKVLKVNIKGADTAVLIGRRGDTLDALQYLTGLVVNKGGGEYKKIMLDAENYRFKREQTLEKLARRLAGNVVRSGKPMTLEPMNPYERRILHATLQSNPRVETFSEGEEPYRRVTIRKK